MVSSILPADRLTTLPILPTDGQRFIDIQMIQWIYNAKFSVWERRGTAEDIPLATLEESGLMSPQDKNILDGVPAVGGGFGIITDTKLLLKSPTNPEGIITGDIKLRSESLDIICVGPNDVKLNCASVPELECTTINDGTQGLQFKLSNVFLDTFFVDARGPKGKTGDKGPKGDQGNPGFSKGPIGNTGLQGDDVLEFCELDEINYNNIDGITDIAIVDLNFVGNKLVVTKAKINVPDNKPADKLKTTSISRSVVYNPDQTPTTCDITRLDNWYLTQPADDTTPLNVQLLRLPNGSNDILDNPIGFNGTMSLESFIGDIVIEYKNRLTKFDLIWGQQIKSYIEAIDNKARGILSALANDLAMCEFNLPAVEYCMTFTGCGQPPPVSPSIAAASQAGSTSVQIGNQKIKQINMGNKAWQVKM